MTILKNNHKSGINENNIKVATVTEEQQVQSRLIDPDLIVLPNPISCTIQLYGVKTDT